MSNLDWLLSHQERSNAYFYLAIADYQHLHRLIAAWEDEGQPVRRTLAAKLRRGIPCGPEPLHDIVTVGARIEYRREPRGPLQTAVLVYPDDLPMPEHGVTVTSDFGALLLGLREGQAIRETGPDGKPFYLHLERVQSAARSLRRAA